MLAIWEAILADHPTIFWLLRWEAPGAVALALQTRAMRAGSVKRFI